ncbi:MAG: UDP-N-acetylglucosamine 2-epimerase (non-hydrolyzing) [Nanoarchaeota archaeon]|nr:UDP-N-acetylglucosamine 2-epimerase (non-hydrolyzing) [Nanoarchaeota archaeon]
MKICIVLGTRPEIIKMSPVIRDIIKKKLDFFIIHSNQHYSENMDKVFFSELSLPAPKYNLGIGSAEHGNQTGKMLIAIEDILLKERPDIVLAQGDTNTVLAAILAAAKQDIKTGHIEAGLRSYDRRMPEEKNRILCDSISDLLFCPTEVQKNILTGEGIARKKISVTGNTIVDAVMQNRHLTKRSSILEELNLKKSEYILFTAHRGLNVDYKDSLVHLLDFLAILVEKTQKKLVWPMHPRTRAKLKEFNLKFDQAIITEPLGYIDFLCLEESAHMIVTDSGGVQEEACVLQVPCITIRENTERPETVSCGANMVVGLDQKKLEGAIYHFSRPKSRLWRNPLGDGTAGEKIVEIIERL